MRPRVQNPSINKKKEDMKKHPNEFKENINKELNENSP
jgi:hypothetical protein